MFASANDWERHRYRKNTSANTSQKSNTPGWPPKSYVSMKSAFGICWTVDIPYISNKTISHFGIIFWSDIFLNSIRPHSSSFGVFFHYPQQLLKADFGRFDWASHEQDAPYKYTIKFTIQNVLVIKRRNKSAQPCNEEWNNDDSTITKAIINNVGCHPPYSLWRVDNLANCTTKEQLKQFYEKSIKVKMSSIHPPPCQQIEKVIYALQEFDWLVDDWIDNSTSQMGSRFEVLLQFPDDTYMETKQTKRYDELRLFGNTAGYIGIILGCRYNDNLRIDIDSRNNDVYKISSVQYT